MRELDTDIDGRVSADEFDRYLCQTELCGIT